MHAASRPHSSRSDRCYRALLRVLPRAVRDEFGDDMAQLFRDHQRASAGHPLRLAALWVHAVTDVVANAAARRNRHVASEPRRRFSMEVAMRSVFTDIRHGLRLLRRYPSTSIIAVATLALGIGANAAIFSVVDAVILKQLPYPQPDRLVVLAETRPAEGVTDGPVASGDLLDWRARSSSFQAIAGFTEAGFSLTGAGDPVQIDGAAVSSGFFDVLGTQPALGRLFRPDDEVFGKARVVVLSHAIWKQRFGGDTSVIGRTITLGGNAWQIIGVLPADFQFVDGPFAMWAPLVLDRPGQRASHSSHSLDVYARLKPNVSVEQARQELGQIAQKMEDEYPDNAGHGATVLPMREQFVKPVRAGLLVLFAAVGFVLLIACVNVANLLLARAASRRREMAVRSALGASRARLIWQSLAECLGLSAAGGVAGVAVAVLGLRALPSVMPDKFSVVGVADLHVDVRVLAFTFLATMLTAIAFGLLPALHASRPDLTETIKQGGRSAAGVRRRSRLALVIGEVALATLIVVGTALTIRSFDRLLHEPLGFEPAHRLTAEVALPASRYATDDSRRDAMAAIETRLRAIPGVTDAGAISFFPLAGSDSRRSITIDGRAPVAGEPPTRMHPRIVTPGYLRTMAIPVLRGRALTASDDQHGEPVVLVSESAVKRFWPAAANPIGGRVEFSDDIWRTIVGVAADVKHGGLMLDVDPTIYLPQAQFVSSDLTFVMKTTVTPETLIRSVRSAVQSVDANLPIVDPGTVERIVAESVRPERAQTTLMSAFGAIALLLAAIGVYGVMSQLVATRAQEIGLRMTLGATRSTILRQFLFDCLWQTAAGVAIGLAAGVLLMRLGREVLYEVQPWDPATLAAVSAVLVVTALVACLVPARRAMRVDPAEALRQ